MGSIRCARPRRVARRRLPKPVPITAKASASKETSARATSSFVPVDDECLLLASLALNLPARSRERLGPRPLRVPGAPYGRVDDGFETDVEVVGPDVEVVETEVEGVGREVEADGTDDDTRTFLLCAVLW